MSDLYVYLIHSRNKDNKNIKGFKERYKTILEYKQNENKVFEIFNDFVSKGLDGEKVRLYRSVNSRNEEKIKEELIIRLLKDKPSITKLDRILASVAQQVENKDESKWLFDFDVDSEYLAYEFMQDIADMHEIDNNNIFWSMPIYKYKTPNGYAIVCQHGFDTRELMKKWKDYDITLMRDGLLFLDIKENNYGKDKI